jgi:hypothetical protein
MIAAFLGSGGIGGELALLGVDIYMMIAVTLGESPRQFFRASLYPC